LQTGVRLLGRKKVRFSGEKYTIMRKLQIFLCLFLCGKNTEFYPRAKIMVRLTNGTEVICSPDKKLLQKGKRKPQPLFVLVTIIA